tara:strand:- start:1697 stop:1954 length:258 start_codon:yes stop_codon:yes gene_type:complete
MIAYKKWLIQEAKKTDWDLDIEIASLIFKDLKSKKEIAIDLIKGFVSYPINNYDVSIDEVVLRVARIIIKEEMLEITKRLELKTK